MPVKAPTFRPAGAATRKRQRRDYDRARRQDGRAQIRKLYNTARWKRLRLNVFKRDFYTCRACGRLETDTSKLVCDHVEPHRGDVERFWAGPFQTLCKPCHDGEKQRRDVAGRTEAGGW